MLLDPGRVCAWPQKPWATHTPSGMAPLKQPALLKLAFGTPRGSVALPLVAAHEWVTDLLSLDLL